MGSEESGPRASPSAGFTADGAGNQGWKVGALRGAVQQGLPSSVMA